MAKEMSGSFSLFDNMAGKKSQNVENSIKPTAAVGGRRTTSRSWYVVDWLWCSMAEQKSCSFR